MEEDFDVDATDAWEIVGFVQVITVFNELLVQD